MTISIRLDDNELELIKKYAKLNDTTVSDVMRTAILEKIEDEFDIYLHHKALESFKKDPKTYTLEEASEILGF